MLRTVMCALVTVVAWNGVPLGAEEGVSRVTVNVVAHGGEAISVVPVVFREIGSGEETTVASADAPVTVTVKPGVYDLSIQGNPQTHPMTRSRCTFRPGSRTKLTVVAYLRAGTMWVIYPTQSHIPLPELPLRNEHVGAGETRSEDGLGGWITYTTRLDRGGSTVYEGKRVFGPDGGLATLTLDVLTVAAGRLTRRGSNVVAEKGVRVWFDGAMVTADWAEVDLVARVARTRDGKKFVL